MKFTAWKRLYDNDGNINRLTEEFLGFPKKDDRGYLVGGCYMFAYSEEDIEGVPADPTQSVVEYIGAGGSSKKSGMLRRTNDFRASITGNSGYCNGLQFKRKFGVEKRTNLYVAYCPLGYGLRKQIAHDQEIAFQEQYKAANGGILPSLHVLEEEKFAKKFEDTKDFIAKLNPENLAELKKFINTL